MFEVKSESHGRVLSAVEDIKACCEVQDDFHEWSDIAASLIQAFLEDLAAEQLDDTCGAFMEYMSECADKNFANGIKDGLRICLNEMLDYIGDADEDDYEDEDFYSDYDRETANLVFEIKAAIGRIEKM
ncbi:MAG: hypothetical protein NC253_14640 [Ruminococcus sp.]|nr:hypothetical protein [Ruminococcus sp.]MCM1382408.1 hypothetical protein [Muribaculaceae bacterium]